MKSIQTFSPFNIKVSYYSHGGIGPLGDIATAEKNRLSVITGALSVEKYLKCIISYHFFGKEGLRKDEFDEMVLGSEWCSYGNKSALARYALQKTGLFTPAELDGFEKAARKAGKRRNAFAHGNLKVVHEKVYLCYFDNIPKELELTDEELTNIETEINGAYGMTMNFHRRQCGEPDPATMLV